jgi:cephalosporin-C deacetylase-like acetyl esterase
MPLIDMPLERLREYGGRNPRPDDFDDYWERGLAEMRAVDPRAELVPAAFAAPAFAECFHCTSPASAAPACTRSSSGPGTPRRAPARPC